MSTAFLSHNSNELLLEKRLDSPSDNALDQKPSVAALKHVLVLDELKDDHEISHPTQLGILLVAADVLKQLANVAVEFVDGPGFLVQPRLESEFNSRNKAGVEFAQIGGSALV